MFDPVSPVPSGLQHPRFVATPLTTSIAALDYAAYLASPEVVRTHSDGRWPVDDFTFDDDLALVAQHQADHEHRSALEGLSLRPEQLDLPGEKRPYLWFRPA